MPGLAGIITKMPRGRAEAELSRMLSTLRHEASYSIGKWVDEDCGVYVGWSARAGAFDQGMPLRNERGDMVLAFAGEEYPDPELRAQLKQRGHDFDPEGPSYLVHTAEEFAEFPKNLNGRFHGILIDTKASGGMLFNDRYGMQRLYIHEAPEGLYFAAEAKAILAVLPELRRIDERSLGEFVSCSCVLENRTLFQGIEALPPGSAWRFQRGEVQSKSKYFLPSEWEDQGPLDPQEYYEQVRQVFSRNLPRYFDGPQRVAMSVTGGLDTRMILAWAKNQSEPLPSYTFGGPYRECGDVKIGREVAQACGMPHQVIPVGTEFLTQFARYAERAVFLSDGCVGVNRAADLYVNEVAAKIAPVRMTGNYGSEILRHLRAFKPVDPMPGVFLPEMLSQIERAKQTYSGLFDGHAVSFTAFRQAPWYQYSLLSLEQTQLAVRSPFLDNDLVRTAFRKKNSGVVKSDLFEESDECTRLIADGSPDLHRIPTDRGLGGDGNWTAALQRAWLEFTFKAEYAYDYGMPQWLARTDHALSAFQLERLFLGRHKFCHYRVWYRDQLAAYVRAVLLDDRSLSRPYVNGKALELMVKRHIKGDRNYTTEITKLLTLELIHRVFVEHD
ncbi:MAG TPA: hypothetical protein VKT75_14540 [Acidobacteriaceae bacterium]|nr:hypothetical protein [Acidobacteriaceae bacterium]